MVCVRIVLATLQHRGIAVNRDRSEYYIQMTPQNEVNEVPAANAAGAKEQLHNNHQDEPPKLVKDTTTTEPLGAETVTTYVTVPPDGGWGWVIVAASFCCNIFVDGIVYSAGVLLEDIAGTFGSSMATVSFVGSLLSGFYLIAGPFVSALANRYGFRVVTILGSFVACISFVASAFAPSIEILCITYGFFGGIGFGLIYVPSVITTGFYFERWRALATGIAVCGSGIGTFLIAPLTTYLKDQYGWRGAVLIQAGLILNCAIFGALFRPLKPTKITVKSEDVDANEDHIPDNQETIHSINGVPLLVRIKIARDELKKNDSSLSLDNEVEVTAGPPTIHTNTWLKVNNNIMYPTAAEVFNASNCSINKIMNSNHSVHTMQQNNKNKNGRFDVITYSEKRRSAQLYPEKLANEDEDDQLNEYSLDDALLSKHLTGNARRASRLAAAAAILEGVRRNSISLRYHTRARTTSESSHRSSIRSRRNTMSKVETGGVRPLYRDDIFFAASLNRLPRYSTHVDTLDYTMSVTHLPTLNDVLEEEENKCALCPEAVRRTLATMLDITLLQSPTFLLLCVGGFITMMGFFVPFMYLKARAEKEGMDTTWSVWLLSTIGITNTLGRVTCGVITSIPGINALLINNIALTIGGIATIISGLSMGVTYQFTYAAVFGLAISCFASLRSIIIVDLIGLEKLTNGFGLLLLFQGIAAVIGSPLAGLFMEITNSHNAAFYLSGGLILLSGILCYPLNWLNEWETKRNAKAAQEMKPIQKPETDNIV